MLTGHKQNHWVIPYPPPKYLEGPHTAWQCPMRLHGWRQPPSFTPLSLYTLAPSQDHMRLGHYCRQSDSGVVRFSGEGPLTVLVSQPGMEWELGRGERLSKTLDVVILCKQVQVSCAEHLI